MRSSVQLLGFEDSPRSIKIHIIVTLKCNLLVCKARFRNLFYIWSLLVALSCMLMLSSFSDVPRPRPRGRGMLHISYNPIDLITKWHDLSTWRAAATILQPALARSIQNPQPIPDEAPVTITTFPIKSFHGTNLECTVAQFVVRVITRK